MKVSYAWLDPLHPSNPLQNDRLKSLTKSGYFSVLLTGEMGTPGITCVFPDLLRVQGVLAWLAYYRASMPSRYTRPSRAYPAFAWTHGRRVLLLRIDDSGKLRCGSQKQSILLAIRMRCVCACASQIIHSSVCSVLFCSSGAAAGEPRHCRHVQGRGDAAAHEPSAAHRRAVPCPAAQTPRATPSQPLFGETSWENKRLGDFLGTELH